MAQKKSGAAEKTTVRRIKATDDAPKPKKVPSVEVKKKPAQKKTVSPKAAEAKKTSSINEPTRNPFKALGNYFKGAWYELKQVRWPNRAQTWSMTIAVLVFSAIFVVFILLLDAGFKWLFEQLLK